MSLLSLAIGSLILFLSLASEATTPTCQEKLKQLRDRKTVSRISLKSTTIDNKEDQKSLGNLEKRALKHALEMSEAQDDIEGVEVQSATIVRKTEKSDTLGYRVFVDAGDEYGFTYYFSAKGQLLFWYWSNQSPQFDFVCEGYPKN